MGGYRHNYIKEIYDLDIREMIVKILKGKKDNFVKKEKIYVINKEEKTNIVGIKTNVLSKTNMMNVMNKNPKFLYQSYSDFIKEYFKKNWKIEINEVRFNLKMDANLQIHPHNKAAGSLYYDFQLDNDNMKKLLKNQNKIIEKLIFHDY